jgi:hypothetical protein
MKSSSNYRSVAASLEYRIKNMSEPHERVVPESELRKS